VPRKYYLPDVGDGAGGGAEGGGGGEVELVVGFCTSLRS